MTVRHWSDEELMRKGGRPDWQNDFVTDLHRFAGKPLRQLKLSHDNTAKTSAMQRSDTLEWVQTGEWTREGGLLSSGVEPVYEIVTPGADDIHEEVVAVIERFMQRRQSAIERSEPWPVGTDDHRNSTLQNRPDRSGMLHADLRGVHGMHGFVEH